MATSLEPAPKDKAKTNWLQSTRDYISELKLEMKRVTWPSRKQVQSTTAVVIVTVFAFAAYFKVVDLVIAQSVGRLLSSFSK
jgi:preprotein translocase subunit SecE